LLLLLDRVLPKVDLLVTNGGYGAVNHALSLGVPIVIAGEGKDKDIVAARVGWTGAGINLKTRNAGAEQIRNAVRTILTKKQYRDEAQRLRTSFSHYDALNELARAVDAVPGQNTIKARPCAEPDSSFYPSGPHRPLYRATPEEKLLS
jgi:UDP:flavonoid glycosyltransferase YjiC (YdhE family)